MGYTRLRTPWGGFPRRVLETQRVTHNENGGCWKFVDEIFPWAHVSLGVRTFAVVKKITRGCVVIMRVIYHSDQECKFRLMLISESKRGLYSRSEWYAVLMYLVLFLLLCCLLYSRSEWYAVLMYLVLFLLLCCLFVSFLVFLPTDLHLLRCWPLPGMYARTVYSHCLYV